MSVWDSLVGQKPVIDMLSRIAQGDPSQITQSWLICGPPGSGRSNMARAFAAALESPDHGMSAEPTRVTQQVLAGTHPDVTVLTTNKVTIGIDQVREIITTSEQMPATAPWRSRSGTAMPREFKSSCCSDSAQSWARKRTSSSHSRSRLAIVCGVKMVGG